MEEKNRICVSKRKYCNLHLEIKERQEMMETDKFIYLEFIISNEGTTWSHRHITKTA